MFYHATRFGTILRTEDEIADIPENREWFVVINCKSSERAIALWRHRCVEKLNSMIN